MSMKYSMPMSEKLLALSPPLLHFPFLLLAAFFFLVTLLLLKGCFILLSGKTRTSELLPLKNAGINFHVLIVTIHILLDIFRAVLAK
ncbi:hypothetical protein F4604DRAFT_1721565 [Suillus subluteus]|nr:hypothetical protein F4604DRAFT_1721565 [Suillus subluteus]